MSFSAFVVGILNQHMQDHKEVHLKAVYQLLSHIKGIIFCWLIFLEGSEFSVEICIDVSYERSTSCDFTLIDGNLLTWSCDRQWLCQDQVLRQNCESWTWESKKNGGSMEYLKT